MKMYKRLLALGLSVAMIGSLAACGGSGDSATTDGDNTVADGGETSGDAGSENTLYNEGETRVIKIGTWYDHYYDSTNTDIWDDPSVSDEAFAQAHFDVVAEVEQKYNVEIQFVNLTFTGIQESINTSILAGKPDCDIYEVDLSFGIPAALNGYALNLADVLPADNDIFTTQSNLKPVDVGLTDGSVYLFTQVSAEAGLYNTYMLAFDKNKIDAAGLEDPRDLYDRGEWTWDKFREYLLALTQDTNGDGVTDVYGFGSRWDFTLYNLLMSNGTTIASSATENLSSPEVGEVLDFIYNMYNVDHVANPWNAEDFDYNMNAYMDGTVAFWVDAAWISSQNNDVALDMDICWMPWPIGPSGNAETNKTRNMSSGNAWMIPTGVENPELVYNVFYDYCNYYNGDTTVRDDREALWWWYQSTGSKTEYQDANFECMFNAGMHEAFDLWQNLGIEYDYKSLIAGEMTPAQFQETYKQQIQDGLDSYFN